ncbi:restriction endonuclease subunit S [Teredinibacter turnerae]|nr:restriction endonuclease subunit S [Teredinibacter turnerae]
MSKQNKSLVPEFRFPEFENEGGWERKPIGDGFKRVTNKNTENNQNALTISAQQGLVSQLDYFNKKVAAKDLAGYYLMHKGDFAYNKSYSQGYPMGAIKPLKLYEKGVVSTLYICFRANRGFCNEFYEQYFEAGMLNQQIESIAQEGGRAHGLLNVSVKEFFKDVDILVPTIEEQQKIADCLTSIDELITLHTQKLDALKAHKKGLMQQLFPIEGKKVPKMRFPEFRKAGEWEKCALSDVATIRSGSTPSRSNPEFYEGGDIPWVKTTDLNNSFITVTEECVTSKAKVKINAIGSVLVAMYGGFKQIGRTGMLKVPAATNQALSVLNVDRKQVAPEYVLVWLNAKVGLWRKIASSSRKDPNITGSDVSKFPISFPEIGEQRKIVDCIFSVEEMISEQSEKISSLIAHKNGLVQKLFPVMDDVV